MKKDRYLYIAIVVLGVVLLGLEGYKYWLNIPVSYVKLSVNPEVELALNANDEVVEVIALNKDADVLISDLDVIGMPVEKATEVIIDNTIETGYIDEYSEANAVVITTANDNEETRVALERKVLTNLNNHLEAKKVYAIIVAKNLDEDLKAEAIKYDISNGKMLLVEEAIALDPTLNKEELVKMSVKEIQLIIKEQVQIRHEALKASNSELKKTWQAEKETLKTTYKAKIEQIKADYKATINNYDSMTALEKKNAVEALIVAKKAAIKTSMEEFKTEIKSTLDAADYPVAKARIIENIKTMMQNRKNN